MKVREQFRVSVLTFHLVLRRDLLASVTYNKVAGPQMSGNSPVSISHLATRLQELQEAVTLSCFVCGFCRFELRFSCLHGKCFIHAYTCIFYCIVCYQI